MAAPALGPALLYKPEPPGQTLPTSITSHLFLRAQTNRWKHRARESEANRGEQRERGQKEEREKRAQTLSFMDRFVLL